jgi:Asp-tRNA(Asn)/Glu-tRNA(Gln) amidotransferase A subunit family amidase
MHGSYPDATEAGKHQQLHVSLPGSHLPNIIVPSRITSKDTAVSPLAGLRFAVKDIFHIKGLKTSGGSRAYYETYGYQNYTTETVELCENAGASLVGKLRTITFALGTPRNGMSVDYHDPWNARGDGYMSTGGSSSGSGAASVAYDWVDFTLGSDTGGSVRFPARFGGLYGYKPTHGIYNLTGILVAIAEQDTPGILTRSPEIFTRVGRVWAEEKPLAPIPATLPRKMLRFDEQPNITQPAAATMIDDFFLKMAQVLDLSDNDSMNITKSFLEANVSGTSPPQPPSDFMTYVYADQNNVQCWDEIGEPLTAAYGAMPGREGASPPVEPPVNFTFVDGQDPETRARYPESQRRRKAFGDWFNTNMLPTNNETCSEYLFAHSYHIPPTTVKTDPAVAAMVPGYYDGLYTNYAGTPEIVVPIGQIQYESTYTKRTEWQTVTVALGVAKGCDLVLFDIVDKLVEAGMLKEVMAGVVAYPVEE